MSPMPHPWEPLGVTLVKRLVLKPTNTEGLILEGWAQGNMVGSLIIMLCITLANMRRGVLLHKLILLELFLGIWHGFWIFFNDPIYAWWLSVSAIPLNVSWSLHNVIAWMKIKPFLPRWQSLTFIGTVILVQPYWVVEIYANFTYFHNINTVFLHTRPWEALCRDPWWIFTTIALFYNIKTRYELTVSEIIRISPRFAVMLMAMLLSIAFLILDICSVTDALKSVLPVGINPFWKLSFVFKCLTDSVVLDDFKTALDRLRAYKMSHLGPVAIEAAGNRRLGAQNMWDQLAPPSNNNDPTHNTTKSHHGRGKPAAQLPMPSPDSDYVHKPHWVDIKTTVDTAHIESHDFTARRHGSRDRDSEENEHRPDIPDDRRVARDARIMREQGSYFRDSDSSSSEYARAMRDVAGVGSYSSDKSCPDPANEKCGPAR